MATRIGEGMADYLKSLDPKQRKLTGKLRTIVKKALPNAEEKIKWGNPTYVLKGKNVAWILNYKEHVDLGFFKGAMMKSPLLEGTGKGLRHIKIRGEKDIKEREFAALVRRAEELTLTS